MSMWLYENKFPLQGGTLTLSGLNSSGSATAPIVTPSTVLCDNLYVARSVIADGISGNLTAVNLNLTGWLNVDGNVSFQNAPPFQVFDSTEVANLTAEFATTATTASTALTSLALKNATTNVSGAAAAAPTAGQTIVALSGTTYEWQTPAGGGGNLTGPITSVGLATSIAAQTGTGTTFVVQTSPTLITPDIGVASATSLDASGTVQGSQLISDVAIGTPPLVVTSTTVVPNLNVSRSTLTDTISTESVSTLIYLTGVPANSTSNQAMKTQAIYINANNLVLPSGQGFVASSTSDFSLQRLTNQIKLGALVGNYTILNSIAPAATRTVTLHDAGANSNFVLDSGGALTLMDAPAGANEVLISSSATTATWETSLPTGLQPNLTGPIQSSGVATKFSGATTATAAGTTTLTSASEYVQIFTGSTTQTVKLPSPVLGMCFIIINRSSSTLTINANDNSLVDSLSAVGCANYVCAGVIGNNGDWFKF